MTGRGIFTWWHGGPLPGNVFPRKTYSRRTHPRKFDLFTVNIRWAIRYFAMAAMPFKIKPPQRELAWAGGLGRATLSISIMTAFLISTSRTEWFPAHHGMT